LTWRPLWDAQVQADAGYIPTHPKVDAKSKNIKPVENYEINLVTPQVFKDNIASWVSVYDEIFK